jgi:hypothetical protein
MPTFADALADGIVLLSDLATEIEAGRHDLSDDPRRPC